MCVCVCMYKIVVEITKETWEKCGIKTVKHYNKKENIIELWQKMSDIEIKLGHSNIANVALELESIVGTKHFLKVKKLFLLLKNLQVI